MRDDIDSDLLRLFEYKNPEPPEEPFRAELRGIGCTGVQPRLR